MDISMVYYGDVDGARICCLTKIILNSMVFIYFLILWYLTSFKNKSTFSKTFFEKKSFSNSKAAESGIKNILMFRHKTCVFLLNTCQENISIFSSYSLSAGTSSDHKELFINILFCFTFSPRNYFMSRELVTGTDIE